MPVETPRLLIRPYREDDLPALHDIHRRPEVVRYVSWPAHESLDDSRELLKTRMAVAGLAHDGDKLVLEVTDRQNGRLLGEVALILNDRALLQGEIGFIRIPTTRVMAMPMKLRGRCWRSALARPGCGASSAAAMRATRHRLA